MIFDGKKAGSRKKLLEVGAKLSYNRPLMMHHVEGTNIRGLMTKLKRLDERFENNQEVVIAVTETDGRVLSAEEAALLVQLKKIWGGNILSFLANEGKRNRFAGYVVEARGTGRFCIAGPDFTFYYEADSGDCIGGDCPEEARERVIVQTNYKGDENRVICFEASLPVVRK